MSGDKPSPLQVAEIPKNSRELIRVALDEFMGSAVLQVRCWYLKQDGRTGATRNGLTVAVHHLPALADALQKALAIAIETGRLPPP